MESINFSSWTGESDVGVPPDFNKYFIQSQPVDEYLNSLEKEMINTIERTGRPDLNIS
jgi:hypothetical protein